MNEFNISQENWDKIIDYARIAYDKYKSEIGGMAIVCKYYDNDNEADWFVKRPVILKQEISMSNTSIDKEELAKYYTKEALYMEKEHPNVEYRFLWWHSHHTMAAFWSGTDHEAINEFSEGDMSFALVVNLKQEYKFRISIWKPIEVAQDVTLNIIGKEPTKLSDKMIKEVKDLCDKETPVTYLHNHQVRTGIQASIFEDVWGNDEGPQDKIEMLYDAASYDPELEKVMLAVDDTCEKFIEGEIDVDVWHDKLSAIESKLSDINYAWRVIIPSKSSAFEHMLTISPIEELIELREVGS